MDDDPEPTLDQMLLESREVSEPQLNFGELKCCAEIGEEGAMDRIQHQESGDNGPVVEPESPKKSVAVKDQTLQTDSKASIFRRKERRDEGQQVDLSSSVNSSTVSLRKPSRRSSQRLIGQESRRSSQQPGGPQPLLSQKSSRTQSINEADTKDTTWVSQRTGKVMKCRSQQTSSIWERPTVSEILCPSSEESTPSKDKESESTTAEETVTSEEMENETYPGQGSRHGSKQLEGKGSKHSSQQHLERFGFRRSSQQSSEQPSASSPKYSRVRPTNGTATDEDRTWISQRTGKEMKCTAQQTSLTWGPRTLSGFLRSSRQDPQVDRGEESEFSTADEVASSGETEKEDLSGRESRHGSKHLVGRESSQPSSQQHLGNSDSRRTSQQAMGKSSLEELRKERPTEEEPSWISRRTGKEMKSKAQQTSRVWEYKTLSDILHFYSADSEVSQMEEEGTAEDEESDAKTEQVTMKDSQPSTPRLESERSLQNIQQPERKPEYHRKKCKSKRDQAQQTDSANSIKKELADHSQQTDVYESKKSSLLDLWLDPGHGTEQTDVQGSRHSSQELAGQKYCRGGPQPGHQDSPRSSQQSQRSKDKAAEENESRVPSDVKSESAKLDLKASEKTGGTEEESWVSQKTGRALRNQGQQTDRSWLQYFASKSQKLKRCISQQTEESFLQRCKVNRLKLALRAHKQSHLEPNVHKCSQCGDLYGANFLFDLDALSSFSTMSILSTICNLKTAEAEVAEEKELSTSGGDEETPELQPLPQQGSRKGSQQGAGQESLQGAGQGSRRGSLQAADDNDPVELPQELGSDTASDSSSLYTEGDDKIQQTYSMISFEDGIWLNRETGKLLVSHRQQTSETCVPKDSGMAPGEPGRTAEDPTPVETDDAGAGRNPSFQPYMEVQGTKPASEESRSGSQQDQNDASHLTTVLPVEEGFPSGDDMEKLVCSRLSEATLLSIDSPDMEDGPGQVYTPVSSEQGAWMNVKTGKLLESQSQQTEAPSEQNPTGDKWPLKAPTQQSSQEGQADIPQGLHATM